MAKSSSKRSHASRSLPLIIEKDEDGFFVVSCPILPGCYTQGKTYDEALENIQEVIELLLEEENVQEILKNYTPTQISFHTISV